VIELPEVKYDKLKLKEICDSADNWDTKSVSVDKKDTMYYVLSGDIIMENDYIKELISIFSPALKIVRAEILRMPPDGGLDAHLDAVRQAVIIFPIQPEIFAPIYYAEGTYQNPTKILYEHYYRCPTIVNAQILHGVRNELNTRDALQISLLAPWGDILKLHAEGKILS